MRAAIKPRFTLSSPLVPRSHSGSLSAFFANQWSLIKHICGRHPSLYSNEDNHIFCAIHNMFGCIRLTSNTGIGIPNVAVSACLSSHGQSLLTTTTAIHINAIIYLSLFSWYKVL